MLCSRHVLSTLGAFACAQSTDAACEHCCLPAASSKYFSVPFSGHHLLQSASSLNSSTSCTWAAHTRMVSTARWTHGSRQSPCLPGLLVVQGYY